jgi:hypothetical protein
MMDDGAQNDDGRNQRGRGVRAYPGANPPGLKLPEKSKKQQKKKRTREERAVVGVQKHDQKVIEKNLTLVLFWPLSDPPTHHGGHWGKNAGPLLWPFLWWRRRRAPCPMGVEVEGLTWGAPNSPRNAQKT